MRSPAATALPDLIGRSGGDPEGLTAVPFELDAIRIVLHRHATTLMTVASARWSADTSPRPAGKTINEGVSPVGAPAGNQSGLIGHTDLDQPNLKKDRCGCETGGHGIQQ